MASRAKPTARTDKNGKGQAKGTRRRAGAPEEGRAVKRGVPATRRRADAPLAIEQKKPPAARISQIQVLDRAVRLLEILSRADGLTLSELAEEAKLAPSSAHRILSSLESHELVRQIGKRGHWLIGVNALRIGSAYLRHRGLAEIARGVMRRLMEETGESVNLAVEDEKGVVFVSEVESRHPIRAFHRPGARAALHASGVGKALLAARPAAERARRLKRLELERFTPNTIVDSEQLLEELRRIRARGWALDDEERTLGMRCVAAPIYNEFGEAVAAISLSGPSVRLGHDKLSRLALLVRQAAQQITRGLGGKAPGRDQEDY